MKRKDDRKVDDLTAALMALVNDPYESELHAHCTHDPCTWRAVRELLRTHGVEPGR